MPYQIIFTLFLIIVTLTLIAGTIAYCLIAMILSEWDITYWPFWLQIVQFVITMGTFIFLLLDTVQQTKYR